MADIPLPEPARVAPVLGVIQNVYTAEQMRAYAATDNKALRAELANARAVDIHSCHSGCTRAGCVAARLREELGSLISQFHHAMKDAGWHPGRTDDNLCDIIREKGKEMLALRAERDNMAGVIAQLLADNTALQNNVVGPLRERVKVLEYELSEILEWAVKERAPLRDQEIASIRRTLEASP